MVLSAVYAVIMGLCQTKLVAASQNKLLFDELFRGQDLWTPIPVHERNNAIARYSVVSDPQRW